MPSKKICKCGKPSVPGLISKVALCQYHFDERMYGKEWADRCKENEPHQSESKMKFKTGTVKARNILEVALEGLGTGVPCWVERVDRVTK